VDGDRKVGTMERRDAPVRFACRAVREMNLAGVVVTVGDWDERTKGRGDEGTKRMTERKPFRSKPATWVETGKVETMGRRDAPVRFACVCACDEPCRYYRAIRYLAR